MGKTPGKRFSTDSILYSYDSEYSIKIKAVQEVEIIFCQ